MRERQERDNRDSKDGRTHSGDRSSGHNRTIKVHTSSYMTESYIGWGKEKTPLCDAQRETCFANY